MGGFDPSGGAGITADLAVLKRFGVRGFSVPTALTAQGDRGVAGVFPLNGAFFSLQCRQLLELMSVQAVKVGMVYDEPVFNAVLNVVAGMSVPVIWDPVMDSSSGYSLMEPLLRGRFHEAFQYIDLLTPNIAEVQSLTGIMVKTVESMETAIIKLAEMGCRGVLIKGGHLKGKICDLLYIGGRIRLFEKDRILVESVVHGTGCCLSSAIAAHIALGACMEEAVKKAVFWLEQEISGSRPLEKGGFNFMEII